MRIDIHSPVVFRKFEKDFYEFALNVSSALRNGLSFMQSLSYNRKLDEALNQNILSKYGFSLEVWEDPYETYRYYFSFKKDGWNISVVAKAWIYHGVFIYGSDGKNVADDKAEEMIKAFYLVRDSVMAEIKSFSEKCLEKIAARNIREEEERWGKSVQGL